LKKCSFSCLNENLTAVSMPSSSRAGTVALIRHSSTRRVTIFSTPGTFMAALLSSEATLPPTTGGRATTANFMPGSMMSCP